MKLPGFLKKIPWWLWLILIIVLVALAWYTMYTLVVAGGVVALSILVLILGDEYFDLY